MRLDHERWGWGPIKGAYGDPGGHVKIFGITYGWINRWCDSGKWSPSWHLDFWGLLYLQHEPLRGWGWSVCKLNIRAAIIRAGYPGCRWQRP